MPKPKVLGRPVVRKPPTAPDVFEDRTSLMLDVVIDTIVERASYDHRKATQQEKLPVSDEDMAYFRTHSATWVRWFHANDPKWRRKLNGNGGRDMVYMFVTHWLEAFLNDPDSYRVRHPMESLLSA